MMIRNTPRMQWRYLVVAPDGIVALITTDEDYACEFRAMLTDECGMGDYIIHEEMYSVRNGRY